MTNKEELEATIGTVIEGIRSRSRFFFLTAFLPNTNRRFDSLLDKCVDLQKELLTIGDNVESLLDFQKKVYALEADYTRQRSKLMLMPAVMFLYLGTALIFAVVTKVDIPGFITKVLGVEAPERLITLGIAGAFLYLATSLLSKIERSPLSDAQFSAIVDFSLRLSLAIIVPIVLVVLFFTKKGEVGDIKVSPELLSFACGYSAKLVMDIFNKIVEKGSKMIEAI